MKRKTAIALALLAAVVCAGAITQINLSTQVQGILAIIHGGTGATTQQGAANAVLPPPTRPGDVLYNNGTNWTNFPGNNTGATACLQENSSGAPLWNTCGSGGGGATLQTNGINNSSQAVLNFVNPSSFQGLSFAFSNPAGGNETFSVSGSLNAAAVGALPGTSGQLLFNNAGSIGAEDPVVSQPTASLLNATVVFASAQPVTLAAGSALAGGVEIFDGAGTNKLAVNSSGQIAISNFPATQTVTGSVTIQNNASVNLAQVNAVALGSPSNYGTSPGAVSVLGVNSFVTNTVTVSGTVTSNIGTTNGLALDSSVNGLLLSQGSTTSGEKGPIVLGAVTTSAPSYTTAQTSPLSLDTSGSLRVNCITGCGGGTGGTAMTDEGAFTQGTTQFTPVGGIFSTSVTNLTNGQAGVARLNNDRTLMNDLTEIAGNAVSTAASGVQKVGIVGNSGAILDAAGQNAASPANELLIAGQFNTSPTTITSGNVSPLQLDSSGNLKVNLNANSFGTVTVSGTVTANVGTTNGLALDSSVNGLLLSQGSTTSGQKGPLIQGAVTTSAPSYTTAQTSPLSLTTAGALRVDGSAVTQPVSGTITANAGTGTFNIQSNASVNLNQVAGTALGATAVTNFGTAPAAAAVPGVNASLFSGTTGLTNTSGALDVNLKTSAATVTVTGTVTANQGGAPWSQNLTQVNSVALGSPSAYGTSPGAVNVPGVNAFITNTPAVTLTSTTITGTVAVTQSTSPWVTSDQANGPVTPGTAATKSELTACLYNSTNAVIANGQQIGNNCDQFGRELVTEPVLESVLTQMLQTSLRPGGPIATQRLVGTFNQPIASTNGALNVYVKNFQDPCGGGGPYVPQFGTIPAITASTQIITGQAGLRVYFCDWNDTNGAAAQNYAVVEGTGTTCGTNTAAVGGLSGGTTGATGWSVAANGGRTLGAGAVSIAATNTPGDNVCVFLSASTQVNGGFKYVFAP